MNLLIMDIRDYIPDIIETMVKVYGDEYRNIISQRINEILYIMYNTVDGMEGYLSFLKSCKRRELSIKFLEKIGIDVSKQKEKGYVEPLEDNFSKLIESYFGIYEDLVIAGSDKTEGILAWKNIYTKKDIKEIIKEKVKFINFYRGKEKEAITVETFEEFSQTDEYQQIENKIKEYLQIFDSITEEYDSYLQTQEIAPYQKYVDDENRKKEKLKISKRNTLYEQVMEFLPNNLKDFLDKKYSSIEEKSKAVLGDNFYSKSYVEYFSQEDEDKLNNPSVDEDEKDVIYLFRKLYFSQIGAVSYEEMRKFKTYKECYEYCIQKEEIKKLIPSTKAIEKITSMRRKTNEEFERDFIYGSQDFIDTFTMFEDTPEIREFIYQYMKDKKVCLPTEDFNSDGEFISIIFYTIKNGSDGGALDYIFLHELCHAIEKSRYWMGFEKKVNNEKNPYNPKKRKYEKLNETITDIFAIEARKNLHEKGIYIFEPKELVRKNIKDKNTHSIIKNLVATFVQKYRKDIIRARVHGDMEGLYQVVGKENFEELNDIVNKVSSMIGLVTKLKKNQMDDPVVIEYHKQLERLNQVYINMEKYQLKGKATDDLTI